MHRLTRAAAITPVALTAILIAAAVNFLFQLGSQSYWVDEVLSIENSRPPLHTVIALVNKTENNPWSYFVLLHEWLGHTGSLSESVTRLPQALAAIALVAGVFWLACAFVSRATALIAAALCAINPLLLEYAQEVRVYTFVLLALAVAVGATVRAVQSPDRRTVWLGLGAVSAIVSLWLHYAALLVIAPLCVYVCLHGRPALSRRQRVGFTSACAIAALLVLPIFLVQYQSLPAGGLRGLADLTPENFLIVAGTPFDVRFFEVPTVIRILAALALALCVIGAWRAPSPRRRELRLLAVLALAPIVTVLVFGLVGKPVVTTRYTGIALPLFAVLLAAAVTTLPRPSGAILVVIAACICGWGTLTSHSQAGFNPPAKQIMSYIRAERLRSDLVAFGLRQSLQWPYEFYGSELLHPPPRYIEPGDRNGLRAAMHAQRRIWIVTETARQGSYSTQTLLRKASFFLRPFGYRAIKVRAQATRNASIAYLAVSAHTSVRR